MDPGYDEGDWELEIRRTQEDANIAVRQNPSLWSQQFLEAMYPVCHVTPSVDCVDSSRADTALVFIWADQNTAVCLTWHCRTSELSASNTVFYLYVRIGIVPPAAL